MRLESLAADAEVHPSHFARAFKQHVGMSAGDYLRRIRVAAAVRRLENAEGSLCEIALETGFSDQSHMGRYFRRYLATTPRAVTESRQPPKAGATVRAPRSV